MGRESNLSPDELATACWRCAAAGIYVRSNWDSITVLYTSEVQDCGTWISLITRTLQTSSTYSNNTCRARSMKRTGQKGQSPHPTGTETNDGLVLTDNAHYSLARPQAVPNRFGPVLDPESLSQS